jgi:ribosomal protein S18 acetylase RimI-like enzyme
MPTLICSIRTDRTAQMGAIRRQGTFMIARSAERLSSFAQKFRALSHHDLHHPVDHMSVRRAERAEIPSLAQLWYDGWRDAHAAILPEALARARTLESFRQRMETHIDEAWVVGPAGAPLGFYMLRGNELYQLFVSAEARGLGVAAALIADAESRLRAAGVETAWLDCAIGNLRAARFYEKSGWHRGGEVPSRLETPDGAFDIEVWRYEKPLAPGAGEGSRTPTGSL